MSINYTHSANRHTEAGPSAALPLLLDAGEPRSLLDVGCGTGTWLKAARKLEIPTILGIDGVELADRDFAVPKTCFKRVDLSRPWDLGLRFDVLLCLEVAEHLPAHSAELLIQCLTMHSDRIFFSAACPGQGGQGHVNCQWPDYWQALFNKFGFSCDDAPRWTIWREEAVEPWYRQNLFLATKSVKRGCNEPRIKRVLHPAMLGNGVPEIGPQIISQVEQGSQSLGWYALVPFRGISAKAIRAIRSRSKHRPVPRIISS